MNSEIKNHFIKGCEGLMHDVVEFGWVVVLEFPTSTWVLTFFLVLWTKWKEWICAVVD